MHEHDRAALVAQLAPAASSSADLGAGVDARERLVHHQHAAPPARARGRGTRAGAGRRTARRSGAWRTRAMPTRSSAVRDRAAVRRAPTPPDPADGPVAAHLDDLAHGDREVPVDRVALRARRRPGRAPCAPGGRGSAPARRRPGTRPSAARSSVDLPAPLGPTIADSAPGREGRVDVPEHRLGRVGDRQAADLEGGAHRRPSAIASTLGGPSRCRCPRASPSAPAASENSSSPTRLRAAVARPTPAPRRSSARGTLDSTKTDAHAAVGDHARRRARRRRSSPRWRSRCPGSPTTSRP